MTARRGTMEAKRPSGARPGPSSTESPPTPRSAASVGDARGTSIRRATRFLRQHVRSPGGPIAGAGPRAETRHSPRWQHQVRANRVARLFQLGPECHHASRGAAAVEKYAQAVAALLPGLDLVQTELPPAQLVASRLSEAFITNPTSAVEALQAVMGLAVSVPAAELASRLPWIFDLSRDLRVRANKDGNADQPPGDKLVMGRLENMRSQLELDLGGFSSAFCVIVQVLANVWQCFTVHDASDNQEVRSVLRRGGQEGGVGGRDRKSARLEEGRGGGVVANHPRRPLLLCVDVSLPCSRPGSWRRSGQTMHGPWRWSERPMSPRGGAKWMRRSRTPPLPRMVEPRL